MDTFESQILNVAVSGTVHDRDASHAKLKAMMVEVERQLQRLRTLHNALTPTGRLPSEVLSEIFCALMTDECLADHATQLSAARALPRWVAVSHVCTHWRRAALACPALWARLDSRNAGAWAAETLARAKAAPLRVAIRLGDCPAAFECTLAAHAHRVRHLAVAGSARGYLPAPALDACVAAVKAAPALETLDVCLPPAHAGETQPLPTSVAALLRNAPVLRALSLRHCTPVWDLPVFCGLTSLVVRDVSPAARPSVDTLISTLQEMPSLAHLELASTLPFDAFVTDPPATCVRVSLPHLTSLHIKDASIITTSNFLNRLAYPRLQSFELECFILEPSPLSLDTTPTIPPFVEALTHLPCGPLRRLELTQPTRDAVALRLWDARAGGQHCGAVSLRLGPEARVPGGAMHAATRVLRVFRLEGLERLWVSGVDMVLAPGEWCEWFGHLGALERITMGNGCWSFLAALRYASRPSKRVDGAWQLFPALRDVKFREMWVTVVHFDHHLFQVGAFLEERGDIRELELEDCLYLQEEDIDGMKRFVGNVIWKRPRWEEDDD